MNILPQYLFNAIIIYLVVMNLLAFAMFGIDKARAVRGVWRIPEAKLFVAAWAGGSAGALAGMLLFRHKTKHTKFLIGIPLILALQIAAVFAVIYFLNVGAIDLNT